MRADRDYFLFLADLEGSTKGSPAEAKARLSAVEHAIVELNADLKPAPLRGFALNYGDEIAALFDTPEGLYEAARRLRAALRPQRFRFVAAQGRIGAPAEDITQIGGPVFKAADAAMRRIKKKGRFCAWLLKDAAIGDALSALVEMCDDHIAEMSDYRYEIYRLLRDGVRQVEIAERLGKAPQSVSEAAQGARARLVIEAEQAIEGLLRRLACRSEEK